MSSKKDTVKVTTLVRVEDVQQTKHAEHLHQFCSDGGSWLIENRHGMCPFSELVVDDQKIVILTV